MFLSYLIKTKFNLIAGMAMGAGMAMICKEMCKKKVQLNSRNTEIQNETNNQLKQGNI